MDYRRFLVEFMEAKACRLMEVGINPKLYFNGEDREDILGWDEWEAKEVYLRMREAFNVYLVSGFSWHMCPFCIRGLFLKNLRREVVCDICSYAKRHGKCNDDNSHYKIILKILEIKGLEAADILSYSFYRSLINFRGVEKHFLVELMKAKAQRLSEFGVDKSLYFTEKDKDDILSWPDEDAKKVWLKIKENIMTRKESFSGFTSYSCPFCIRYYLLTQDNHSTCYLCTYAKRHNGFCGESTSDFKKIKQFFKNKNMYDDDIFNYSWYKRIIDKIESKYKNNLKL